ncbi:hypothetical protein MNBD_GAMMA16-1691 [hydrothermal vent metagenome]|uniref:PhnO-related protein n=1 Tax=hydrothermal vent metagenome TaxID=652676 RepID=A0A3B0ZZQ4_9ZZZZ
MVDRMLIVESIVEGGHRFRPSDWIERIASIQASFGPDHRLHYSSSVRPCIINGEKCLIIDPVLQKTNPAVYEHILQFVTSNCLIMHEVK